MRRSTKWLIAAGFVAFLAILALNVPASIIARWLPQNVEIGSLGGSLWHGEALGVRAAGFDVERVEWRLHPLALFSGAISAAIEATNGADHIAGDLLLERSGRLEARGAEAQLDIASLAGRALPRGWSGPATLHLEEAVFADGKILSLVGVAESGRLHGPPQDEPYLGSYRVTFDRNSSRVPGELSGRFTDTSGPIEITGDVTLYADRRSVISGWVRARPSAPPSVVADIARLPEVDPQGRRRFSIENSF